MKDKKLTRKKLLDKNVHLKRQERAYGDDAIKSKLTDHLPVKMGPCLKKSHL